MSIYAWIVVITLMQSDRSRKVTPPFIAMNATAITLPARSPFFMHRAEAAWLLEETQVALDVQAAHVALAGINPTRERKNSADFYVRAFFQAILKPIELYRFLCCL